MKKVIFPTEQALHIHIKNIAARLMQFGLTPETCTIKKANEILKISDIKKPVNYEFAEMIIKNYITPLLEEVKNQTSNK
jgi:ferritin-like protein